MKLKLVNFDETHYASNIVQADNTLRWNACGHTHSLIVRTDFGERIDLHPEDIAAMERIPSQQFLTGQEIELPNKYVVAAVPKGYVNNYSITTLPATYAVFCCSYDSGSDLCTLYQPNDACLYQCDVRLQIDVQIKRIEPKKHLFGKASAPYYSVQLPRIVGYTDGSLRYSFDRLNYTYPITKSMLGRPFYVLSYNNNPPQISSTGGDGYKITVRR